MATFPDIHPDIEEDAVLEAARESLFGYGHQGWCNACGAEADGVEPDLTTGVCEECGEAAVAGAETFLIYLD